MAPRILGQVRPHPQLGDTLSGTQTQRKRGTKAHGRSEPRRRAPSPAEGPRAEGLRGSEAALRVPGRRPLPSETQRTPKRPPDGPKEATRDSISVRTQPEASATTKGPDGDPGAAAGTGPPCHQQGEWPRAPARHTPVREGVAPCPTAPAGGLSSAALLGALASAQDRRAPPATCARIDVPSRGTCSAPVNPSAGLCPLL